MSPDRLQRFILDLEATKKSDDVWHLLVGLGRDLELPCIDFVSASGFRDWRKTRFVRTSYDSTFIADLNQDPEVEDWSNFRLHVGQRLTPIAVGIEFLEDSYQVPKKRKALLRVMAEHGLRAGLCIPLREVTPPEVGMITFFGDHNRRDMQTIIRAHGWTLHAAAMMGHQRYLLHFAHEFRDRNHITKKQIELVRLIGLGMKDKTIAETLCISVSAVRQRMQALLTKTGLSSRAELAVLAMRLGLLPDPFHSSHDDVETVVEMDNAGTRTRPKM